MKYWCRTDITHWVPTRVHSKFLISVCKVTYQEFRRMLRMMGENTMKFLEVGSLKVISD